MYYTNVDLYANLKQLRGLCRQEFHQCSPVLFPTAAGGRGRGRGWLAGGSRLLLAPTEPPVREPQLWGLRAPVPSLSSSLLSLACEP